MALLYLALGTIFGFVLSRSGAADYNYIQAMFLFTSFQLYGIIGTAVVVTAPGLGQPRPKRRGEARGLHLFEIEERSLRAITYAWTGSNWCTIGERRFPRGTDPLDCVV